MKKIIIFILFCTISLPGFSQSLNYQDIALLLSKEDHVGTARFNGMSGAFGALGGDLTAIKINPAGAAVFKNSALSVSLNSRGTEITANYYNNATTTQEEYVDFSQAGAAFVFNQPHGDWTRFVFSFNFNTRANFNTHFIANGNSGVATFTEFPLDNNDPKIAYKNADTQQFVNTYNGEISEYNFAVSGLYQQHLYVGASLNTFDVNFSQQALLTEENNDGNNNSLNASFYQENNTIGTGFSLSAGFIYKATKSVRLGLSYQTPVWFT